MEAEARYAHLKELVATSPDFGSEGTPNHSPETLEWLGRLHALLDLPMFGIDALQVSVASDGLGGALHQRYVTTIKAALYRAIAKTELLLPASSRGAFIPAGNAFDAIAASSRILAEAKKGVLFVDPYLGPKTLESFAIQANEGVVIGLLGAKGRARPGLEVVARAWVAQYGEKRPLTLRYASKTLLHDRLILIDNQFVWDVSQSFEDLAARSPATLSRSPTEPAVLKIEAYREIYDNAEVIL